jgi:hypothetical protein
VVNGISYGPVLNTAAVALTAFGNVPLERDAHLVGMLTGQNVSAGFVDKANAGLAAQLSGAGFAEAMQAALMGEPVRTFTGHLIVDGYLACCPAPATTTTPGRNAAPGCWPGCSSAASTSPDGPTGSGRAARGV